MALTDDEFGVLQVAPQPQIFQADLMADASNGKAGGKLGKYRPSCHYCMAKLKLSAMIAKARGKDGAIRTKQAEIGMKQAKMGLTTRRNKTLSGHNKQPLRLTVAPDSF